MLTFFEMLRNGINFVRNLDFLVSLLGLNVFNSRKCAGVLISESTEGIDLVFVKSTFDTGIWRHFFTIYQRNALSWNFFSSHSLLKFRGLG